MNVFIFRRRVRRRLPEYDAVRNVTIWGERVFSFNQRGSEIAKQHQCSEEPKNDDNGLPRNKYQHESTSGGLRATCDSLLFYRRMLLQGTLKMRPPSVRRAISTEVARSLNIMAGRVIRNRRTLAIFPRTIALGEWRADWQPAGSP